jgi:hypothetical protein
VIAVEALSDARHPDGAAVALTPRPGAVFALLDD